MYVQMLLNTNYLHSSFQVLFLLHAQDVIHICSTDELTYYQFSRNTPMTASHLVAMEYMTLINNSQADTSPPIFSNCLIKLQ